jgi:hypothetical protein
MCVSFFMYVNTYMYNYVFVFTTYAYVYLDVCIYHLCSKLPAPGRLLANVCAHASACLYSSCMFKRTCARTSSRQRICTCNCHLGWRTLVLKCNKNNYDCTCICMFVFITYVQTHLSKDVLLSVLYLVHVSPCNSLHVFKACICHGMGMHHEYTHIFTYMYMNIDVQDQQRGYLFLRYT